MMTVGLHHVAAAAFVVATTVVQHAHAMSSASDAGVACATDAAQACGECSSVFPRDVLAVVRTVHACIIDDKRKRKLKKKNKK